MFKGSFFLVISLLFSLSALGTAVYAISMYEVPEVVEVTRVKEVVVTATPTPFVIQPSTPSGVKYIPAATKVVPSIEK